MDARGTTRFLSFHLPSFPLSPLCFSLFHFFFLFFFSPFLPPPGGIPLFHRVRQYERPEYPPARPRTRSGRRNIRRKGWSETRIAETWEPKPGDSLRHVEEPATNFYEPTELSILRKRREYTRNTGWLGVHREERGRRNCERWTKGAEVSDARHFHDLLGTRCNWMLNYFGFYQWVFGWVIWTLSRGENSFND